MLDLKVLIYFLICTVIITISNIIYKKLKILDFPNDRKVHKNPIPTSGGLSALILGIFYIIYSFIYYESYTFITFLVLSIIIFLYFLGLCDELYQVNAQKRLLATTIIYLIFFTQDIFNEDDQFFLINFLEIEIYSTKINLNFIQSIILTIFCILSFQNAMNMIDGINGLSSMIFIIINVFIFYYSLDSEILELNKALIIFLIVFFVFNIQSKLFFGESGIYLICFFTSLLIIFSYKKNFVLLDQVILLLLIPGLDMIRVSIFRLKNKLKISRPDKNHIHHLLSKKISNNLTLLTIFLMIVPINLIAIFFPKLIILLIIASTIIYLSLISVLVKK